MEKISNENNNQEKAEVAISGSTLISEKDLRTKTRDKESYFIMLKGSIHQEHIIALLSTKKKLIELKILYMFYCISSLSTNLPSDNNYKFWT